MKMKKQTINFSMTAFILIFLFYGGTISGQSQTERKTYSKSIQVNREVTLELNNKYGSVNITPWSRDVVSVKAEIEASAPNQERLRNMINGIDVSITQTDLLVRVETEFSQNITTLVESFKEMTSKVIPYESGIQINYSINVPEYLNMKITNKFGDVFMENSTGNFSLNLSNGSFKANSINEAREMELVFCEVTINKLVKGNMNASFSDVEINESQDLTLTSVSSKFYLKQVAVINVESRRDKFYIGTIESIKGESYFTDYKIDNLLKEVNLDAKYGDLNIDLVDKGFELVSIKSTFADIDLTFNPTASYNLDIKHLNAFLVVPENRADLKKRTINEDKKEYTTYGTVGSNPGNVKVLIDATRGNIRLK
jgi:hypothetical protein